MNGADQQTTYDALLRSAARRLKGHERRLFQAEVTNTLCSGNARRAEHRFGWGRETIRMGLQETKSQIECLGNFKSRGRKKWEQSHPQLVADVRSVVEPCTQADPELKSQRTYTNLSAREVLEKLKSDKHYTDEQLPSERTMRRLLNRLNYRLKRIQKGKPKKKRLKPTPSSRTSRL